MKDTRIAVVTSRAPVGEIKQNLGRTRQWVQKAALAGAHLVCFPELNITGYTTRESLASMAQTIPGPLTIELAQLSGQTGLVILAGLVEQNPQGLPFASHGVFHPDGRIDRYRKSHLAPPERHIFSAGNQIPVFKTAHFTFGIQLCYDSHFPELSTAMAVQGADLIFIPHASPRGAALAKHTSWMRHLPARAFDNGLFVVACNQWGDNGRGLVFPGNAVVIGPDGKVLKKKVTGQGEQMLIADLAAGDLDAVRTHAMRYFFPHRRPELYTPNLS
jgi:predicted amidohydrolase